MTIFPWGKSHLLAIAENLPSIDARQLEVTPKEISRSGRVYRFKMGSDIPRTGNLILVQIGNRPIMAFRILKTDSYSKEIIAKRIRRYDQEGRLDLEKKYLAAEKVADLVSPPVSESIPVDSQSPTAGIAGTGLTGTPVSPEEGAASAGEAKSDQSQATAENEFSQEPADPNAPALLGDDGSGGPRKETPIVAGTVESYDEDLDASTSPRDLKTDRMEETEASESSRSGLGVEEKEPAIKYEHMAGLSVGSFSNMSGFSIPGTAHNGFTAYYNEIIDREIWFKEHAPQDSLSLEFGLGYYSRVNLTGIFDNYDVIPIRSELLYTLQFNPTFAFIAHVGAQFNWVITAENASELGLSTLQGIQPNAGIGMLYNIGPQWYLRADAGLDRFAIGLAVKW